MWERREAAEGRACCGEGDWGGLKKKGVKGEGGDKGVGCVRFCGRQGGTGAAPAGSSPAAVALCRVDQLGIAFSFGLQSVLRGPEGENIGVL